MKVIVFGSTGTVGKKLIEQALNKGHQVTAFSRNTERLSPLQHPNLRMAQGDVLHLEEVSKAITGQDVVCVVLGAGKNRKSNIRSLGTKNIITAMKEQGISRLICQTTLGAGDSMGNLNFIWKHIMFGWYLKDVFLDHELQEQYVKESGLDWTIIRPGAFTNGAHTGPYRHGFDPNDRTLSLKISRADVADFILRQLGNDNYLHQTPGLSY